MHIVLQQAWTMIEVHFLERWHGRRSSRFPEGQELAAVRTSDLILSNMYSKLVKNFSNGRTCTKTNYKTSIEHVTRAHLTNEDIEEQLSHHCLREKRYQRFFKSSAGYWCAELLRLPIFRRKGAADVDCCWTAVRGVGNWVRKSSSLTGASFRRAIDDEEVDTSRALLVDVAIDLRNSLVLCL